MNEQPKTPNTSQIIPEKVLDQGFEVNSIVRFKQPFWSSPEGKRFCIPTDCNFRIVECCGPFALIAHADDETKSRINTLNNNTYGGPVFNHECFDLDVLLRFLQLSDPD